MKFVKNNKAICLMIFIILACVIISVCLLLKYFYFGSGNSKYGDRLDGIENVEITDEHQNSVVEKLKSEEIVSDAKIDIIGKRICIRIVFNDGTLLDSAKNVAVKIIDEFSEEEQGFYDLEFTLVCSATEDSEGYTIMGNKNVNGTNLVWNNFNTSTDE